MRWQQLLVTGASAAVTLALINRIVRGDDSSAKQRQLSAATAAWSCVPAAAAAGAAQAAAQRDDGSSKAQPHSQGTQPTMLLLTIGLLLAVAGATASRNLGMAAVASSPLLLAALVLFSFLLGGMCAMAVGTSQGGYRDKTQSVDTLAITSPLPPPVKVNPELAGVWVKDTHLSDAMDPVCDLMQLNGVVRVAVRLVRGIEVRITEPWEGGPGVFELAVFSVFPWFKVREKYELNGAVSRWNRRDLRPGKHRGTVCVLPSGNLLVQLVWDEPHGGHGTDEFILMGRNELHVKSTLYAASRPQEPMVYNTVYYRKQ